MHWHLLHQTAMGGAHRVSGLPCQDNAVSEDLGWARIVIVADGHGSRKHFRSERGSRFACAAALTEIRHLLEKLPVGSLPSPANFLKLKKDILSRWKKLVEADIDAEPWNAKELAEASKRMSSDEIFLLKSGGMPYIPYGSTLIAGFATDAFWAGIQIGDGFFVTMDGQGDYIWSMPESRVNEGNRTASLCMGDPMPEFRHCVGTDPITGLAVCTDGIEKSFPVMGDKVISFLHWLWLAAREDGENGQELLKSYAERVATRSAVKDDVGIAIMADTLAQDVPPRRTQQQMDMERRQAAAHIEELQTVIDYTRRQLKSTVSNDEAEQLQRVLDRRMAEKNALIEKINLFERF